MITWSLENAIETADSMKSRGHGLKGRTSYSLYKFDKRDAFMLCTILFTGLVLMILLFTNAIKFRYYPSIKGDLFTVQSVIFYIFYIFNVDSAIGKYRRGDKMETYAIKNLSFRYPETGIDVLKDITFSVNEGEFITVCGPSGCGKSTLLRHLKPDLSPHGSFGRNIL